MKKFLDLPIFVKFLTVGLGTIIILVGVLLVLYHNSDRAQTIASIVEKARSICLISESAREEMEDKWRLGLFSVDDIRKYAAEGNREKLLAVIPVVSAWRASMRKAEAAGYSFRVPKFDPRNPENEPDYGLTHKVEGPALKKIKKENLDEYYVIDEATNSVRYFLPVRLTEVCLVCHGDPAQSKTLWGRDDGKDPTGGTFEDWNAGEIHGAFQVIQSLDPADADLRSRMLKAGVVVIAGIVLAGVIFFFVTRSITKPLVQGVEFAEKMADGDMSQDLEFSQADETGQLAKAMNDMGNNLRQMMGHINDGINTLSGSSGELTSVSETMNDESQEASGMAVSVADAAVNMSSSMSNVVTAVEETSTNVNSVSAAAEEMSATISDIAKNSEQSRSITEKAVEQANHASVKVKELGGAAEEIGQVTATITDISEQTNLLALNATIEAARAGDAGKGFAVVANEIKDLANQTADATTEIRSKIERMQGSAAETATEISEIIRVITDVNDIVSTIAAAVDEQSAVTNEIAENVSQASMGIGEVTGNVSECASVANEVAENVGKVSHTTTELSSRSQSVKDTAAELSTLAARLEEMMKKFKLS